MKTVKNNKSQYKKRNAQSSSFSAPSLEKNIRNDFIVDDCGYFIWTSTLPEKNITKN